MLLKLLRPGKFSTRPIPGGVAKLYSTNINNSNQWLLERGYSVDLPILLILHGGPGSTDMWLSETCNAKLEEHFIVVNWDQRGAGKSFDKKADPKHLNIGQFVDDAQVLIDHLLKKYDQPKLYLLGQSWGSALGWRLSQLIPQKLHHYIGVGQITNMEESEIRSFQFVLEKARQEDNRKAIKELESLTMPKPGIEIAPFKPLMAQRKWLAWYGGMVKGQKKLSFLTKYLMSSKEYSLWDVIKFVKGTQVSIENLWQEIIELNLFEEECKVEVPVTFVVGTHDHTVAADLTKQFFKQIVSPSKNLIEVDTAHMANLSATEEYSKSIICVKPIND